MIVPCVVCDTPYRQYRSDQLYCSGKCASKAWRAKRYSPKILTCPICKQSFDARKVGRHKYCSSQCLKEAERQRGKSKASGAGKGWSKGRQYVKRQTCLICEKPFYAPPVLMRRGGGKYCSHGCRGIAFARNPAKWPQSQRRGKAGKREDLGGLFVRSRWEANYARYLNWLVELDEVASWAYEPDVFEFRNIKRGTRFYTPDFKITNNDGSVEYHEIKGYMDQRSRTQLKRMAKYYSDVKLVLIDKDCYYAIAKQVQRFIPHWEHA